MAQQKVEIELTKGAINELPQLYNPSVRTAGLLHIVLSAEPHLGTAPHERRSPDGTIVALRISLEDAVRLAVEISTMAEARGVTLPKGVLFRGELH